MLLEQLEDELCNPTDPEQVEGLKDWPHARLERYHGMLEYQQNADKTQYFRENMCAVCKKPCSKFLHGKRKAAQKSCVIDHRLVHVEVRNFVGLSAVVLCGVNDFFNGCLAAMLLPVLY